MSVLDKLDDDAIIVMYFMTLVAVLLLSGVLLGYCNDPHQVEAYKACVAHHQPAECRSVEP